MPETPPDLASFISAEELDALIQRARREDLGPHGVDVTSQVFIPAERTGEASMIVRAPGHLAGAALLPTVAAVYDRRIEVELAAEDGQPLTARQTIATFRGPLRSILSMERVALNLTTHLCGVATFTAHYVAQTNGTRARIYDTRKTLPGLRALEKYAVACGGGMNHRLGLHDAMLIKDNHLAGVRLEDLPGVLRDAAHRARRAHPDLKFVEVEVDTIEQLQRVLEADVDMVLLDNMTLAQMHEAVALRDARAPGVELEASGGIILEEVAAIAATGVDRISVGALTHSAPSLDLGLDIR